MKFSYTVSYGEKPISEWLIKNIKEYAKNKYGLELTISLNTKYENTTEILKKSNE